MSGKKEKLKRRAAGLTSSVMQGHRAFEQDVRRILAEREAQAVPRRRTRRQNLAWVGLGAFVITGLVLLVLAIRWAL